MTVTVRDVTTTSVRTQADNRVVVQPEHPASPKAVGKWLCHYTTADAAFEYILPTGRLRMSPYRLMRDPLEERDLTFSAAYFPGAIPAAEEGYWNLVANIARVRGEMRLLSLTMDADHYDAGDFLYAFGWARARLWEQYASNHAGVCLIFNRERLHAALESSLDQQGTSYRGAVEYSPRGFYDSPSRIVVDANLLDPTTHDERIVEWVRERHVDLFFRKTDDWRSEHEYRYVLASPGEDHAFADFGDALARVIVGSRFARWQVPGAQVVCERIGVELRRMTWDAGQPYPGRPTAP